MPSYRPGSARTTNINFQPQPGQQTSSSDLTRLTIFDTANKFVAFKDSFIGGIRGVVCEWGSIWIFGLDNKVHARKLCLVAMNALFLLISILQDLSSG